MSELKQAGRVGYLLAFAFLVMFGVVLIPIFMIINGIALVSHSKSNRHT